MTDFIFRLGQNNLTDSEDSIINNILSGRNCVVIAPDCVDFKLLPVAVACKLTDISLIISDSVEYARISVARLKRLGVPAAFFNDSLTYTQKLEMLRRARNNQYKLIFITPDKLSSHDIVFLSKLTRVSFLAFINPSAEISDEVNAFIESIGYKPHMAAFISHSTDSEFTDGLTFLDNPLIMGLKHDVKISLGTCTYDNKSYKDVLPSLVNPRLRNVIICRDKLSVESAIDCLNEFKAMACYSKIGSIKRDNAIEAFLNGSVSVLVIDGSADIYADLFADNIIYCGMPIRPQDCIFDFLSCSSGSSFSKCTILYSNEDKDKYSDETKRFLTAPSENLPDLIAESSGQKVSITRDKIDITTEVQKVISCLLRMNKIESDIARVELIKVITGHSTDSRFTELSTYGIMNRVDVASVITEYLIQNKLIIASGNNIIATNQAIELLKSRHTFYADIDEILSIDYYDSVLFNKLSQFRLSIARSEHVPSYCVLDNYELIKLCVLKPSTSDELALIIGDSKNIRYGDVILDTIKQSIN